MTQKLSPSFRLEQQFQGVVAGVDEAGCGPWAGPVVAGAVIFMDYDLSSALLVGIHDSKKLTASKRQQIFETLMANHGKGLILAHGLASVEEIDALNIAEATKLAMQRAVSALACCPDMALVDGIRKPKLPCPLQTVIKGDQISYSIAAASIVAKVVRDQIMHELSKSYPEYGWANNAGYGTATHSDALAIHGVTPHHRCSFKPIANLLALANTA